MAESAAASVESDAESGRDDSNKFKRFLHQHVKPFVFVVLILCTFRSSIADWNDVPTGSMNPSILEGDRIFVNKLAYDLKFPFTTWHLLEWGGPERGDVVVFYSPPDGVRMVKRVVGLPGDTVELRDGRLLVNGEAAHYGAADPRFPAAMRGHPDGSGALYSSETLAGRTHPVMALPLRSNNRNYGPEVVPDGQFCLMGDNRDNSSDSRVWGFVERSRIVGRASAVAISLDPDRSYLPRWGRFFTSLP
jgi:signal peptidase I